MCVSAGFLWGVSCAREAGPDTLGFGALMICWEEAKYAEVALGGTGGELLPRGHSWCCPGAWRAVVSDHRGGRLKPSRPNGTIWAQRWALDGPQALEGGRQEVLATRGCPGTRQQEVLGGEEALEATGPRCSGRLSGGGIIGCNQPDSTLGSAEASGLTRLGDAG